MAAGGAGDASEGLHEGLSQGRGGRGKGATPQPTAGPPEPEPPGRPPAAVGGRRQGTRGPPSLPPPLRPKSGRRQTVETAAPSPPRGGRCSQGGGGTAAAASAAARQAPPVNRPHAPALPATDQQRTGGAQDGANGAAPSEARQGKAGARTRARRSLSPPSPPPTALTNWRRA